jgi:RNA polymerase sigma-70 factor (ECF subfamily)
MASDARGIASRRPVDANLAFGTSEPALSTSQPADLSLQARVLELYDQLRAPVFRYLVCLGSGRDDADEIVQETFLRAYKHLRQGGEAENLRGWLFRVAHNIAINQLKKQRRLNTGTTELVDMAFSVADPSPDAEAVLLSGERLRHIFAAMKTLSPQERECVNLRSEGLRYREIADVLGIGISTVADSLRRAIAKLVGENDE